MLVVFCLYFDKLVFLIVSAVERQNEDFQTAPFETFQTGTEAEVFRVVIQRQCVSEFMADS